MAKSEELVLCAQKILNDLETNDFNVKDNSTQRISAITFKLPTDGNVWQNHIILEACEGNTVRYLVRSKAYGFYDKYFDEFDSAVKDIVATYLMGFLNHIQSDVNDAQRLGMTKDNIIHYIHWR